MACILFSRKMAFMLWVLLLSIFFSQGLLFGNDERMTKNDRGLFLFSGVFTKEDMVSTANPFTTEYDKGGILGVAFQQDMFSLGYGLALGWELGVAGRRVERCSGEIWGGLFVRHKGLEIVRGFQLKPSFIMGLSAVDRTIGVERENELRNDGDARLLFYLGPELAFSLTRFPRWELVYRLHHRSGANKFLGEMKEGMNAILIGFRYRF